MSAVEGYQEQARSSAGITLNSKGEAQLAIKVYDDDIEKALLAAQEQFKAGMAWLRANGLRP